MLAQPTATAQPEPANLLLQPHFGFVQTRYYQVMDVYINSVRCPTGFAHVVMDFLLRRLNATYDECYDDRVGLVFSSCLVEDMRDCVLEPVGSYRPQIKPIPYVAVTMRFEGICAERVFVTNQLRRVELDLRRAFYIHNTLCGQLIGVRCVAKTPVIEMHAHLS
jgi:hypothetical protein